MANNTFGNLFTLTTFGESHGEAIGGIIDGCPSGLELDLEVIQQDLDRRKPGQSAIVTQRKEADKVQFLSGIFEGKTTGTPIGFIIQNTNQKSKDYSHNVMYTVLLMPIILMIKNMAFVIIVVVEELQPVKPLIGLLLAQWLNN